MAITYIVRDNNAYDTALVVETTADGDTTEAHAVNPAKGIWHLIGTRSGGGAFTANAQASMNGVDWQQIMSISDAAPVTGVNNRPCRFVRVIQNTGAGATVTLQLCGV